jgi:hypothetical protein
LPEESQLYGNEAIKSMANHDLRYLAVINFVEVTLSPSTSYDVKNAKMTSRMKKISMKKSRNV